MATLARLAQLVDRAARDDLAPVAEERFDQVLERQQLGLPVLQRHHVDAEHGLHRRLRIEIVEHDVGDFAALQLDDDAHSVLVGLVTQFRDALDQLPAHQVGDTLEQARLVDLVGQLGDDDCLIAAVVDVLDVRARAHQDAAAAGGVGAIDFPRPVDDARGREIRTGDQGHQFRDTDRRVVDQRDAGIHDFGQVVGRNVGRHADGDAGRAVDQQVGHAGRQHRGLDLGLVVVGDEVDRLLVDVGEQLRGEARHAHLGVAHCRRRVAVDRTEVALPVHDQVTHRERLRHAHDRVVDRDVAVRVVLADHVAHDARALLVGLVPVVAELAHRVQHTAVNRLQTVANVGQRATHDHAHRVVEVRLLHLVFEVDVQDFAGYFGHVFAMYLKTRVFLRNRPGLAPRRRASGPK